MELGIGRRMRSLHWSSASSCLGALLFVAAACSRHSSAPSDESVSSAPEPTVESFPTPPGPTDARAPTGAGDPGGAVGDLPPAVRDAMAAITPSTTVAISLQPVPQVPRAESVLRENLVPRAKLCYERSLLTTDPTQAGDLVVLLTLGSTGQVASVSADPASTKGLSTVAVGCILAAARKLSFEVAGDGTGITLHATLSLRPAR